MKISSTFVAICISTSALSGCVIAPAPPPRVVVAPPPGVIVPVGVVYATPVYAAPAPGYVWVHHPRHGWGWHHHHHGWHRGWN
jgi:hypothetical protein